MKYESKKKTLRGMIMYRNVVLQCCGIRLSYEYDRIRNVKKIKVHINQ